MIVPPQMAGDTAQVIAIHIQLEGFAAQVEIADPRFGMRDEYVPAVLALVALTADGRSSARIGRLV